jgi:hypothetical protein
VFPYGFTKAYYYLSVGWAGNLFFGSARPLTDFSYEVLLKSLNVVFACADAGFVYLILRRLVSKSSALTSAVIFLLNPAIIFVMSVWGSTETISLFFVLGSIFLAEEDRPLGAWLMLAAAAYTRPQMLVFGFLLGLVYLRKFSANRNLISISWTVVVCFIFILPFALTISPSVPIDYVARTFAYHIANGQADQSSLGLSPASFSVWTLPMLLVSGQHSWLRMWSPSTMSLVGPLTYGQVGAALSAVLLIGLGVLLILRPAVSQDGRYIPLVTCGLLGWLLVTPGVISRYFVYAIAMVILCRPALSRSAYVYLLSVLSVITFVSMYGHLASDFMGYSGNVSVLSPNNNPVSHLVYSLFLADFFISLASLSNIAVLISVAAVALGRISIGVTTLRQAPTTSG